MPCLSIPACTFSLLVLDLVLLFVCCFWSCGFLFFFGEEVIQVGGGELESRVQMIHV